MKKLIALLMLVACFALGQAQELKINSITSSMFDGTANSRATERLDFNGELCALIKVQLPLEGAEFLGNTVGETVNHSGEYWVYVINGTRQLHLHHKLFKPLVIYFPDFGIKGVEGGVTYIADISVPAELWAAAAGAASGTTKRPMDNFLVLNVTPPNAKVFIGGQEKMVSEGICSVLLKAGTYAVRVEASGYQTEEFQATIGDEKVVRDVSLRSTMATLTVRSATSGARIFLNGNAVGTGSWTGSIMPDTYLVELKKEGYRPAERRVTLAMNATETLDSPALEAITGDIIVSSTPAGASIELDGRTVGTTPEVLRSIPVGTHTLRLTRSGYQPSTSSVTVTESSPANLDLTLRRQQEFVTPTSPGKESVSTVPVSKNNYSHLDLAAERDGQYTYFSTREWNALSYVEKATYHKVGIVINQPSITAPFILALTDNGKNVTWQEAMASGINMPTKIQGEAIVRDYLKVMDTLKTFGGSGYEGPSVWFWTTQSSGPSTYYGIHIYSGVVYDKYDDSQTLRVRKVIPLPSAMPTVTPMTSNSISKNSYGHAKAHHLDLAAECDGKYVFFTEAEWSSVPSSEKGQYTKKGIVINQPSITEPFILALTDNGKDVKWKKAMASGINMPTKIQGEAIVKDCANVNKALKAFGGTGYEGDSQYFWTKDAKDSSYAWYVAMYGGFVTFSYKANTYRVRAVAPVPEAEAM